MTITDQRSLPVAPAAVRDRERVGLGIALVSAATFGSSGTFADGLLTAGWSPAAAVGARLLVAAVALTIPAAVVLRRSPQLRSGGRAAGLREIVLYGLVPIAGCQLCYFEAVRTLSVAVALLLEYSGVLMVAAWQWARHGQRPGRWTQAGGLTAIVGLILAVNVTGHQHVELIGVLWGLGAAVGLAVYFLASAGKSAWSPLVVSWGGLAVGAAVLFALGAAGVLPFAATRAPVVLAHHRVSWLVPVLGLGVIAAAIAYSTGIAAVRILGARLSSFVGLAEVIFSACFAWLILGQTPAPVQLLGGVLVIVGILLVRAERG